MKNEAPVYCVLRVAELRSDVRYAALSYVWATLWELRDNGFLKNEESGEPSLLWVDAICINPKDVEERNHQVTLMASIYNNATSVFSWLGIPDEFDRDDFAIAIIRHFICCFDDANSIMPFLEHDLKKRLTIKWLVLNLGPVPYPDIQTNENWKALLELQKNAYWRRMWVIQEFVFARSESVHWLICWDEAITSLEHQRFNDYITDFLDTGFQDCGSYNLQEKMALAHLIGGLEPRSHTHRSIKDIQRTAANNPGVPLLVECVRTSAASAYATDPRDFVYAIASIVPNNLKPDYRKRTRDVYIDAVLSDGIMHCIRECLSFSGNGYDYANDFNLPPWVPDFSKISKVYNLINKTHRPFLSAIELRPAELIQRDILRVQGVIHDRVKLIKPLGSDPRNFTERRDFLKKVCVGYLVEFRGCDFTEDASEKLTCCSLERPLQKLIRVLSCGYDVFASARSEVATAPLDMRVPKNDALGFCPGFRYDSPEGEDVEAYRRLGLPSDISLGNFLHMAFTNFKNSDFKEDGKETWGSLMAKGGRWLVSYRSIFEVGPYFKQIRVTSVSDRLACNPEISSVRLTGVVFHPC